MQIDENTLYRDFLPFERLIKDGEAQRLKDTATRVLYPDNGFWDMTLSDFFACCGGHFACMGIDYEQPESLTVLQVYGMRAFSDFVTHFCDTVERLSIPETIEEVQAQETCLKVSFEEGIVMFLREFFGLPSFGAAYSLTLFDYLMARKQAYNKEVFQRKMNEIMQRKMKIKNTRR